MRLFMVEIGPHRDDIGLLTGGALLVTANDSDHAAGVADEYILELGLRAKMKVKEVREVHQPTHEARVVDRAFVYE